MPDSIPCNAALLIDLRTECLSRANRCVLRGEVVPALELMAAAQKICHDPRVEDLMDQLSRVRSPLPALSLEQLQEARRLVVVGELEAAEAIYQELLELHPRTPVLLRDLVEIRREAGNLAGALVAALRRLSLEPDSAEAREEAALLLEAKGQGERAAMVRAGFSGVGSH
jgi:predicted Zn-dependent protease